MRCKRGNDLRGGTLLLLLALDLGLIGWAMLIIGLLLLLAEAASPGFFVAVPGTVLVVLGIIILAFPGFLENEWAPLVGVVVAVIAGGATIYMYRRIAPGQRPSATSMDSLVGMSGTVTRAVEPDSIRGKVKIQNQVWSATARERIPAGARVRVVESSGVHIIVKEEKK